MVQREFEGEDTIFLNVSTNRVVRVMILAVLVLVVASLVARLLSYMWGREGLLSLLTVFDVGGDITIPTWFSSFALLLCSILLGLIAAAKKRRSDAYTVYWTGLSIIFLLMSVDEVAAMHEKTGRELFVPLGLDTSGFLYYSWVILGAVFVLIILLVYLRFLAHLPKRTRHLFLLAGALYVAGAIGMEMLSARVVSFYGEENWGASVPTYDKMIVVIQTAIEELLEMLGVVVFIYALLRYLGTYIEEIVVQISVDNE